MAKIGWLSITALKLAASALEKDTVSLVDTLTEPELWEKVKEAIGHITEEKDPRIVEAVARCIASCRDEQLTILKYALEKDVDGAKEVFQRKCWEACADYRKKEFYDTDFEDTIYPKFVMAAGKIYEELKTQPDAYLTFLSEISKQARTTGKTVDYNTELLLEIIKLLKEKTPMASEPPRLLTEKPGKPEFFLCRDEDLENLRETLKRSHCVSLNGIGGVGKSTLAKQLFSETWTEYDHAAWVNYNGDLDSSLLGFDWPSDAASPKEKLRQIYEKVLENPNCRTLLVIDNVDGKALRDKGTQGNRFDSFTSSPFLTVVITQRKNVFGNRYYSFPVPELDERQCAEIFKAYYTAEGRSVSAGDEEAIAELIELAWRNTKVLSIMAKSVRRKNTLHEYVEELKENLNRAGQKAVGDEKLTLPEHMRQLFPISERSEEERRILQTFALMPSVPIPAEVEDWIHAEEETLNALCDAGLLDFGESEQTRRGFYSMHPLVKETILLDRENPALFPESIGEDFAACLAEGRYVGEKETHETALTKLAIADGVLTAMGERETGEYVDACDQLATIYWTFGNFDPAEKWASKSVRFSENLYGTEDYHTAAKYGNLAMVYFSKGNFAEAEKLYLKQISIEKKYPNNTSVVRAYINLSCVYGGQKKLDEAEQYIKRALMVADIANKLDMSITNNELVTLCNDMASLYIKEGKYGEAEQILRKTRAFAETAPSNEHLDTSHTYYLLGALSCYKRDYDQALKWFEKVFPVWLKRFGPEHPKVDFILDCMRRTFPFTAFAKKQSFDTWLDGLLTNEGIDWRPENKPGLDIVIGFTSLF